MQGQLVEKKRKLFYLKCHYLSNTQNISVLFLITFIEKQYLLWLILGA